MDKDSSRAPAINWPLPPWEHAYPAAESYLRIRNDQCVAHAITALRVADVVPFMVKDIFRASQRLLWWGSHSHVEKNCRKIKNGTDLSFLRRVVIADVLRGPSPCRRLSRQIMNSLSETTRELTRR